MADYRFSFMNLSKIESPNWMAPEGNVRGEGILKV